MTDEQKETLKFYTTNDYLLINGLLWGEDDQTLDKNVNFSTICTKERPNKSVRACLSIFR